MSDNKPDAFKILYGIKSYEIISHDKSVGYGRINFKAVSGKELTKEQLFEVQCRLGYHPDGYGQFNVSKHKAGDDTITTWQSSASCD